MNISGGTTHQFPEIAHLASVPERLSLPAEQATHLDAGIEHHVTPSIRVQATVFRREEHDVLRGLDPTPRIVDGEIVPQSDFGAFDSLLSGRSRGLELLLERQAPAKLTGWVAYSYGRTRYSDPTRQETYWADFDQRHSITAVAMHRLTDQTTLGARFRAGSGNPVAGYLESRDGGLFVGAERNRVRLPSYARLDIRGSQNFRVGGRRVTLFLEAINILNRHNRGPADGFVSSQTGRAFGFTEELLPRRFSAGLHVDFGGGR